MQRREGERGPEKELYCYLVPLAGQYVRLFTSWQQARQIPPVGTIRFDYFSATGGGRPCRTAIHTVVPSHFPVRPRKAGGGPLSPGRARRKELVLPPTVWARPNQCISRPAWFPRWLSQLRRCWAFRRSVELHHSTKQITTLFFPMHLILLSTQLRLQGLM